MDKTANITEFDLCEMGIVATSEMTVLDYFYNLIGHHAHVEELYPESFWMCSLESPEGKIARCEIDTLTENTFDAQGIDLTKCDTTLQVEVLVGLFDVHLREVFAV